MLACAQQLEHDGVTDAHAPARDERDQPVAARALRALGQVELGARRAQLVGEGAGVGLGVGEGEGVGVGLLLGLGLG